MRDRLSFFVVRLLILGMPLQPGFTAELDRAVPKASCGPQDRTEGGLQGQTTLAERFSPGQAKAYNCNLELVGHFQGEGNSGYLTLYDRCAYYTTWQNAKMQHPGVPILDISDIRYPTLVRHLNTPATMNANEFLSIDPTRKLLFANGFNTTSFEVYDISKDCRQPILKATSSVPGITLHAGQFSPDYRTLYGGSCCQGLEQFPLDPSVPSSAVFAVDTSDPTRLRALAMWVPPKNAWWTHAVSLNQDASRAYVSMSVQDSGSLSGSGLAVLDITDIQARKPHAQFRLVSSALWDDASGQEFALPVTVKGHSYLVVTDVAGSILMAKGKPAGTDACPSGKPGWGFARIVDIADEKNPQTVSRLMLEADAPENCAKVRHDPTVAFGYGSLACSADREDDARMVVCGYNEAGVRVFDIRDPAHPREVAYYKPPAQSSADRPGSVVRDLQSPELKGHTADDVWVALFRSNAEEIAFVSTDGDFQIVRFSDRFKESHKELFQ